MKVHTTDRPAASTRPKDTRRLTADLPTADSDLLNETATLTGYNKLTTLIRAIRVLADLEKVVRAGGEVIIKEADGSRSRLILR